MADTSPKIAFYIALWNDYKSAEKTESSYIYKYLKLRKDEQAALLGKKERNALKNAARLDVYVYVQSLFMDYEKKQITEKALIKALRDLAANKTKLQDLAAELDEAQKDPVLLEKLRSNFLDKRLRMDVQTFFTDIGYTEKTPAGQPPGESRKKNEILDLYFGFAADKECEIDILTSAFSSGASVDKTQDQQYVAACKRLFDALLAEDASVNAFVPLFIDEATGSGIIIIGSERLGIPGSDGALQKEKAKKIGRIYGADQYHEVVKYPNCAYYIVQFLDFGNVYGKDDNRFFDLGFGLISSADNKEGELEKLIDEYREFKNLGRFYENYPDTNEDLDAVGKSHPLFGKYLIQSATPKPASAVHESYKKGLVDTREDELYAASKADSGKGKN